MGDVVATHLKPTRGFDDVLFWNLYEMIGWGRLKWSILSVFVIVFTKIYIYIFNFTYRNYVVGSIS